jgi:surfeit locus 1 family protein
MSARTADRRLVWASVATLAAFAVLVALGWWQWQRKAWKEGLIAQITARTTAVPVDVTAARDRFRQAPGEVEYLRVAAEGRFDHTKERYFYAPVAGGTGWHVMSPLVMADGGTLWVNRGLVPDPLRDPAKRSEGQIAGPVRIVGLARLPTAADTFTPANDPARNIWYRRDIEALDASAFPPSHRSLPFVLEADDSAVPGGWPKGGITRLAIPNRHLEYALTWWGLAATLVGVYAAFAISRRRAFPQLPHDPS